MTHTIGYYSNYICRPIAKMPMQCQEEYSSRSNLAETCHAMLVSTDAMSKSRHQQLLQSLPVNFCGPMVYPHKLVDHGSNHILILIDFLHPPVTWHLFSAL